VCAPRRHRYQLEFAYLALTFSPRLFAPLIATVMALQSAVGLVAWPFFATVTAVVAVLRGPPGGAGSYT
jgi:hypothetical protein